MAVRYPQSTKARFRVVDSRQIQQVRFLAFLFLLSTLVIPAHAQHRFEAFTTDNGLPQNVIRGIHQTPDGYLWIATFDGLARFDGVRCTIFNKSTVPGLTTNCFGLMLGTPGGDLWLRTEASGVTRYHRGSFETYGAAEGIPGNIVRGITRDDAGHVWILTQGPSRSGTMPPGASQSCKNSLQPDTNRSFGITPVSGLPINLASVAS